MTAISTRSSIPIYTQMSSSLRRPAQIKSSFSDPTGSAASATAIADGKSDFVKN
jgi:hypothetical protein